jgi:hypothetical protein
MGVSAFGMIEDETWARRNWENARTRCVRLQRRPMRKHYKSIANVIALTHPDRCLISFIWSSLPYVPFASENRWLMPDTTQHTTYAPPRRIARIASYPLVARVTRLSRSLLALISLSLFMWRQLNESPKAQLQVCLQINALQKKGS